MDYATPPFASGNNSLSPGSSVYRSRAYQIATRDIYSTVVLTS